MARKRLSDLLREEVKKPSEASASPEPEVKEGPEKTKQPPEQEATASKVMPNEPSVEATGPSPRETELEKQIADLKAELKQQTTAAKKLQTNLEHTEKRYQQLETELAEAKQTALQLADNNAQLKQELDTLKQSQKPQQMPSSVPTKSVASAKPVPASASTPSRETSSSHPLTQQEVLRRRQADSLAHPMFPAGNSPGHLSEQDLGWVD